MSKNTKNYQISMRLTQLEIEKLNEVVSTFQELSDRPDSDKNLLSFMRKINASIFIGKLEAAAKPTKKIDFISFSAMKGDTPVRLTISSENLSILTRDNLDEFEPSEDILYQLSEIDFEECYHG